MNQTQSPIWIELNILVIKNFFNFSLDKSSKILQQKIWIRLDLDPARKSVLFWIRIPPEKVDPTDSGSSQKSPDPPGPDPARTVWIQLDPDPVKKVWMRLNPDPARKVRL